MNVPRVITLQLVSTDTSDLSGVIVGMTVSTGRRNPRRVYFPKTDRDGCSALDREDFLGQFADATEADLMGSWGTIADASAQVEVALYDPAPIIANGEAAMAWPLLPYEQKKWPSRSVEYAYRASCRNLLFTATPVVVNLDETSHIEFRATAVTPSRWR